MGIVEFLRARFDDDERAANNLDELAGYERNGIESTAGGQVLDYLDHFSPERMLRQIERDRRMVDLCEVMEADPNFLDAGTILPGDEKELAMRVLMLLALPYAGHPDYDLAWAPDSMPR